MYTFFRCGEVWSLLPGALLVNTLFAGMNKTKWYSNNKPPMFDGLYHQFMVIRGMVSYCYTNIFGFVQKGMPYVLTHLRIDFRGNDTVDGCETPHHLIDRL